MHILNNINQPNFKAIKSVTIEKTPLALRNTTQKIINNVKASNEIKKLTSDADYDMEVYFDSRCDYSSKNLVGSVVFYSEDKCYEYNISLDKMPLSTPDDYVARAMLTYFSPNFKKMVESCDIKGEVCNATRDISKIFDYTRVKLNPALLNEIYVANLKNKS